MIYQFIGCAWFLALNCCFAHLHYQVFLALNVNVGLKVYKAPFFSSTFIMNLFVYPQGHSAEIISCSFNTTGDQLLTGSFDHTVSVWDTATGRFVL